MGERLILASYDLLQGEILSEHFESHKPSNLTHASRLGYLLDLFIDRADNHSELKILELSFSFNFIKKVLQIPS